MTKDAYFEMCDALSQEPIEEEIPVELSDFPDFVQTCMLVYGKLSDIWDTMGGNYCGKDYAIVFSLFNLYNIEEKEEQLLAMDIFQSIDSIRTKIVANKITAAKNSPKPR